MNRIELVHDALADLPYMTRAQAEFFRSFIVKHNVRRILEIGFYKGKSSALLAAILEDLGRGHLTTIDQKAAAEFSPSIVDTLQKVGLTERVTPIFAERSYTWELGKMVREARRPRFDLCYFDGGHIWDATGFGFYLVNELLRPGGWIVFDDLDWTLDHWAKKDPKTANAPPFDRYSADERASPAVRLVFEHLVARAGYANLSTVPEFGWGIAQKKPTSLLRRAVRSLSRLRGRGGSAGQRMT